MVKPLEGSNQTATRVKVLSPEILYSKRPTVLKCWKATRSASTRQDELLSSGSKAAVWLRKDITGTWEARRVPRGTGYSPTIRRGEGAETAMRESDRSIVEE
jgi:hypothetical protein